MSSKLDLNNTFGAFLIGTVVSSALFGVTCTQIFYYFQNYSSDGAFVKGVVILLLICEALHSALAIHATYYYIILNYVNPEALVQAIWSLILTIQVSAVIILVVHIFYARRVYHVSGKNILLVPLIMIPSSAKFAISTVVVVRSFQLEFFTEGFLTEERLIEAGFALAVATDTIIAGLLSYYLYKGRSDMKSTNALINKLMIYAINNGILTSVFDILVLAFTASEPNNLIQWSIFLVVGNLYTNSVMATLNSRKKLSRTIPARPHSTLDFSHTNTEQMTTFQTASRTDVATGSGFSNGTKASSTKQINTVI